MAGSGPTHRLLIVAALLALSPARAAAQTLRGQVVDGSSEAAIARATLRLVGADSLAVASAVTDDAGGFALTAPAAGEYMVRVESLGYDAAVVGPVRLRVNGFVDVTLALTARPIPLDSVAVQVGQQDIWLQRAGYYERKEHSGGVFLDAAQLAQRHTQRMGDALSGVQGVRVLSDGGVTDLQLRGRMTDVFRNPRICLPLVYLDGLLVSDGQVANSGRFNLDSLPVDHIAAIEIYMGEASVPLQFARGGGACGAAIFWTKSP